MSDERDATSNLPAGGAADAGRGVYAPRDAAGPDPLKAIPPEEPGSRWFRRDGGDGVAVGPRSDGSVGLWIARSWDSVWIDLTPADAILIGRALVEMGEAMQQAPKEPPR